jgi:hypothetical protein
MAPRRHEKFMQAARVRDLVDVGTQTPVLQRTGRHFDGGAGTRIVTASTDLSFPVKGRRECAVMSAVDGSGNHLSEYRSIRADSKWTTEIAITPDSLSVPQIHLIAAVSSRLIFDFFASAGGACRAAQRSALQRASPWGPVGCRKADTPLRRQTPQIHPDTAGPDLAHGGDFIGTRLMRPDGSDEFDCQQISPGRKRS